MSWISAAYRKLDRSPRALRRFGLQIGAVLLLLGIALVRRHGIIGWSMGLLGATVIGLAEFGPTRLRYFHQVWMSFSLALGEIVRPMFLTTLFYLVLTPLGLLQRLVGKRDMELAFRTGAQSYWKKRTTRRPMADYEKQF
jgi:Saxitoxin biosynthesis operon protein SxtJ